MGPTRAKNLKFRPLPPFYREGGGLFFRGASNRWVENLNDPGKLPASIGIMPLTNPCKVRIQFEYSLKRTSTLIETAIGLPSFIAG